MHAQGIRQHPDVVRCCPESRVCGSCCHPSLLRGRAAPAAPPWQARHRLCSRHAAASPAGAPAAGCPACRAGWSRSAGGRHRCCPARLPLPVPRRPAQEAAAGDSQLNSRTIQDRRRGEAGSQHCWVGFVVARLRKQGLAAAVMASCPPTACPACLQEAGRHIVAPQRRPQRDKLHVNLREGGEGWAQAWCQGCSCGAMPAQLVCCWFSNAGPACHTCETGCLRRGNAACC